MEEFQQRFGSQPGRIADDLLRRGCCNWETLGMWISTPRLRFNVIDPSKPPQYPANVGLLCPACMLTKRRPPLGQWIVWRSYRARWKANRLLREAELTAKPS